MLAQIDIQEHVTQLNRLGYTIFRDMADEHLLQALRQRVDELVEQEGASAAEEHHQEEGCHRLANLVNKDPLFDQVWLQPEILACMKAHFDRPFKLSSLNAREALKGGGHQPLHQDWKMNRDIPTPVYVMNALWVLDDISAENGAPRVVPGTHRIPELPEECLVDCEVPHPDQITVDLPAGSVILMDAHTWHGGTANYSGRRRRMLHSYWIAREYEGQQDQRHLLQPATRERLTAEQLELLLGVEEDLLPSRVR